MKSIDGSGASVLTIDGKVVATGTLHSGYANPAVYFGNGTTTGGNVTAAISFFRFSTPPTVAPEPARLAMLGLGLLASAGFATS